MHLTDDAKAMTGTIDSGTSSKNNSVASANMDTSSGLDNNHIIQCDAKLTQ
jgi:hypothetical protein